MTVREFIQILTAQVSDLDTEIQFERIIDDEETERYILNEVSAENSILHIQLDDYLYE